MNLAGIGLTCADCVNGSLQISAEDDEASKKKLETELRLYQIKLSSFTSA